MTYTLAVVDEGLLGLTRFTAPNPWNEFYKKEASRLESWDIFRYVMSAYGGKLETLVTIPFKGLSVMERFRQLLTNRHLLSLFVEWPIFESILHSRAGS